MPVKIGNVIEFFDMALDSAQLLQVVPQLYRKFVKGIPPKDEKQVQEQIQSGDPEIVEEALSGWASGFSGKDEIRILGDICWLVDGKKITVKQGLAFMDYLKSLDDYRKSKIRKSYIEERNILKRWSIATVLSKLDSDEERTSFLDGPGMFDKDTLEKAMDNLQEPYDKFAQWAERAAIRMSEAREERLQEIAEDPDGWGYKLSKNSVLRVFLNTMTFNIFGRKKRRKDQ